MKIEDLNKQQIVLLVLLVSFVTSIATGIITVSLLDQAPDPVVQTINRVVERTVETVEKVVPDTSQKAQVITKETTVVVKEEDLITDTIEKGSKSLVRLEGATASADAGGDSGVFVGLGVFVTEDGLVMTDASAVRAGGSYRAILHDATAYDLVLEHRDTESGIAFMKLVPRVETIDTNGATTSSASSVSVAAIPVAGIGTLKLGQGTVALGGESANAVYTDIVSSLTPEIHEREVVADDGSTTVLQETLYTRVETARSDHAPLSGEPLLNTFGELIALAVSGEGEAQPRYIAIRFLKLYQTLSDDAEE